MIMSKGLQKYDDKCHKRLNQAELQRGLLTEAQKPNSVCLALETAGAIQTGGLYGLAAYLRHDVTLAAEIFIA